MKDTCTLFEFIKKQKKKHYNNNCKLQNCMKYYILDALITGQSLSERLRLPPPTYKHIKINIPKLKN